MSYLTDPYTLAQCSRFPSLDPLANGPCLACGFRVAHFVERGEKPTHCGVCYGPGFRNTIPEACSRCPNRTRDIVRVEEFCHESLQTVRKYYCAGHSTVPATVEGISNFLRASGLVFTQTEVRYLMSDGTMKGRVDITVSSPDSPFVIIIEVDLGRHGAYDKQAELGRLHRVRVTHHNKPLAAIRIGLGQWKDDNGELKSDNTFDMYRAVSNLVSDIELKGKTFFTSEVLCCYLNYDLFRGITPFFPVVHDEDFGYRLTEDFQDVTVASDILNSGAPMTIEEMRHGMRKLEGDAASVIPYEPRTRRGTRQKTDGVADGAPAPIADGERNPAAGTTTTTSSHAEELLSPWRKELAHLKMLVDADDDGNLDAPDARRATPGRDEKKLALIKSLLSTIGKRIEDVTVTELGADSDESDVEACKMAAWNVFASATSATAEQLRKAYLKSVASCDDDEEEAGNEERKRERQQENKEDVLVPVTHNVKVSVGPCGKARDRISADVVSIYPQTSGLQRLPDQQSRTFTFASAEHALDLAVLRMDEFIDTLTCDPSSRPVVSFTQPAPDERVPLRAEHLIRIQSLSRYGNNDADR
eukprot:GHVU01154769.1.p1 GENE.GHVU01154769.1~~GHVU01154769.1.p1  ORF type:complete len:587 (+),score=52.42 GHVU01154769.1:64-1824(+)